MKVFLVLGSSVSLVLYTACDELFVDEYEGHYTVGFEVSSFVPCGSKEAWWVTGSSTLVECVGEIDYYNLSTVFARVKGKESKKGKYGHLGGYEREFDLKEVLECREPTESDCG